MSARELFARQLLQFHGLTVEKAVVITEVYPTMTQLLAAYEKCKSVGEKENLLAKFKVRFYL